MVRRLDRLTLRSSERIHWDPVERKFDRFAMAFTGTRMRASGLRGECNLSGTLYADGSQPDGHNPTTVSVKSAKDHPEGRV
jgi:hypothetical protein